DSYLEYESDKNEEMDAKIIEVLSASNQNQELLSPMSNSLSQSQKF
ncbi:38446_t:CDS:2, partial [Gigaspora margarita]